MVSTDVPLQANETEAIRLQREADNTNRAQHRQEEAQQAKAVAAAAGQPNANQVPAGAAAPAAPAGHAPGAPPKANPHVPIILPAGADLLQRSEHRQDDPLVNP